MYNFREGNCIFNLYSPPPSHQIQVKGIKLIIKKKNLGCPAEIFFFIKLIVPMSSLADGIIHNSSVRKDFVVFRCNLAPIAKYENDAGQRTNLTSLNPSLIRSR